MTLHPPFRARILAAIALALAPVGCGQPANPAASAGVTHRDITAGHHTFTVVQLDLTKASLQLFWKSPEGHRYANFQSLDRALTDSHLHLLFAANSGIFDPGFTPTGLHVEAGHELTPLNLKIGSGNFYLKPNGVFSVDGDGAKLVDAASYPGTGQSVRLAVQSGPLLVLAGTINSLFGADSANRQIRSGVGIESPQHVVFAISRQPVTFYEFAAVFKTQLNCQTALYLDGGISQFCIPPINPADPPGDFAGILAVTDRGAER